MQLHELKRQIREEIYDLTYSVEESHDGCSIRIVDYEMRRDPRTDPKIRRSWSVASLEEWLAIREEVSKTSQLVGAYEVWRSEYACRHDEDDLKRTNLFLQALSHRGITREIADAMIERGEYAKHE